MTLYSVQHRMYVHSVIVVGTTFAKWIAQIVNHGIYRGS